MHPTTTALCFIDRRSVSYLPAAFKPDNVYSMSGWEGL